MGKETEKKGEAFDLRSFGQSYAVNYQFHASGPKVVKSYRLTTLLERYVDILWEPGSHKSNVRAFISELDEILLGQAFEAFTDEMVDRLIGDLRKRGNSNATINRKMAALSKLLRKAFKMGEIHSLPEFRRQKEKAGRIRFLEFEEEDRLFSAIRAKDELYYALCVFLVDTGARLGEGIGLRWNDLHENRATFWITKSGKSRTVPLTPRAIEAIEAQTGAVEGPFASVDQQRFRWIWNAAKAEVGLGTDDDVVPHVLRHTCASRLVRGGIDIRRVQMWLGHQTLQMTMRYAHLASHDLDVCLPILLRRP
ncbi:site-specific integrase [Neorhizobium galegae]|uniref:tyrosine-type recombinase/integrase n=1 Tax=Neorhizobium galegae TaxID=399 RepID=UPI00062123D2|nr:site-specific integrase [Neorhizobium galegae]CDZ29336.1 Integrase for prophage CP-933T [Neorhizobium galegae bv. officinalis]KAB1108164.1 tyrosine-type recombinase/integrase [Neorhizobium galegae]MCQ1769661.1 site-specific integrase [Neorhizobium galegae]MCQ1775344.1 site-specific integrase [Neorhizobium galegae]MCQ1777756.1 site-specific integrase [Neorhizobium galegae]